MFQPHRCSSLLTPAPFLKGISVTRAFNGSSSNRGLWRPQCLFALVSYTVYRRFGLDTASLGTQRYLECCPEQCQLGLLPT